MDGSPGRILIANAQNASWKGESVPPCKRPYLSRVLTLRMSPVLRKVWLKEVLSVAMIYVAERRRKCGSYVHMLKEDESVAAMYIC